MTSQSVAGVTGCQVDSIRVIDEAESTGSLARRLREPPCGARLTGPLVVLVRAASDPRMRVKHSAVAIINR